MKRNLCILIIASILLPAAALAQGLPLVKDGASDYEILVAPDAFRITVRAAKDLQHYLTKSTGAELPIRRGNALGAKPAIIVGDHPLTAKAGIASKDMPLEGFRIKTIGTTLYIVGRDTKGSATTDHWRSAPQSGTWYGVSEFLESQLGIRWFFPGDMGEVVPKHETLTLPALDVKDGPKMTYRRMTYVWDKKTPPKRKQEVLDWKRRNRNGWSVVWSASHVWLTYLPGKKYFKDHPEWFALVNGRRLGYMPHGLQMCTTNPEALDEFARVIIEYGKKNPGVMFSLSPNDGGNHCECKNCTALDVDKFPDGTPVMTDRYVTYCNEVAKRVCKVLPDQTFGFYAYSFYADPPKRTKLHPNVKVMEVLNDASILYLSERVRDLHVNERLIPWKKAVGTLYFYGHPEGMGGVNLPSITPTVIKYTYANLHKAGVTGFAMCNGSSFASTGLNNYLYLQMAWNPGRDFNALYAEALTTCYGSKAAPFVHDYVTRLEKRTARMTETALKKFDRSMGSARRIPDSLDIIYPGIYEEGMPILEKALAATETHGQKARVMLLVENLKLAKMSLDLYTKGTALVKAPDPKAADIVACHNLAKARRKWMRDNDQTNYGRADADIRGEKRFAVLPYDPEVYEYLLAAAKGVKKEATAKRVKKAPVIDGLLNDAAWKGLTELPVNLNKDNGRAVKVKTIARIARTKTHLYIGVVCEEPLMGHIKDSVRKRDGKVWAENELEFFFDCEDSAKNFHQLCVNTLGTIFDKSKIDGKSVEWDSQARVATTRTKDSWTLEMAIPLKAFGTKATLPGDIWGFNICRVRPVAKPSEYTCWSPTFGGFQAPKRFGKLILH
jgi:Domain of unknown function (DUF4838)/Carbohydrate family 9 binding domain-like